MRTFIFLLCTTVFGFNPKTTFAQERINIDRDKEITVDQVFELIMDQTEYRFLYPEHLFNDAPKIKLKRGSIRIDKLLNENVNNENFNIILINDNTLLIKKRDHKEVIKLSGKVTDKAGVSIPGVTVTVKGTTIITITDIDGNFSIVAAAPENIIVFTSVGYKKKEIVVGNQKKLQITLEEDISELNEVQLITTGYQKINPEHSTGSIASIGAKEYNSRINTTDFLTGLQNKLPGVLINNDVQFEGNNLFQIRGISTINGNRSPLIVIDGYPSELSLESINPNDIESVTVLKDAAAATIYGVRASNGVIIIERKEAKKGKLNVNYRSTFSLVPKTDYSRYRWDEDVSSKMTDFLVERNKSSAASLYSFMSSPVFGYLFNYPQPVRILAEQASGLITETEAQNQYAALKSYNNTEDYSRLFLRNAATQTYNLDFSGGSNDILYHLTTNYSHNNLEQITNDNNRFRLSSRTIFKFSNRFKLNLNMDFQEAKRNSTPTPTISSVYPFERFLDDEGNPEAIFSGSVVNPYYNKVLTDLGLLDNLYYPLVDMKEIKNTSREVSNSIVANFNYDLKKGFNLSFGGIYQSANNNSEHLASGESSEVHQYVNRYAKAGTNGFVYNVPKGSFLKETNGKTSGYTVRAQLNYNKKIAENHSINMILGGEIRNIINKSSTASYFGYNDQTLLQQPINYYTITNAFTPSYANNNPAISYAGLFGKTYTEDRFVSAYSNLVYSFQDKYSATGSIRIDQSNLFGTDPKYRYKPLWSLGLAWNLNKENFLEDVTWLKSLKLRAAIGFNGNIAKNSLPQIIASSSYSSDYSTIEQLSLSSPANSKLRWEQTYNTNLGLDFRIFKSINGSIEYYIKKSTDVLATNQIDPTRGVSSALVNESALRNSGLEFTTHADWITRRHFNWNSGFVFSYNTSKILDVYNNAIKPSSASYSFTNGNTNYLEGYPIGTVFNYRYAGLDPVNGKTLIYGKDNVLKHFDENQEGLADVINRGTIIPKYNIGLSNRVDVGSFYFYTMFNFYGGFVTKIPVPNPTAVRPLEGAFNYWKQAGDETIPGVLPALTELSSGYATYISALDKFTIDGSYFTIGDITASYSFKNTNLVKETGISNLELSFQASNVYTFALNKQNYSKAMGSYEKNYITPTYTFALNLKF
ncbi:SusC/RagA family TonB-linked outer membrane protein [Flavobacterium flavipallidum]|uniref:SusC/RagA family TonB-linked outer membrane protein n=1 Tax=Flavobacterium flavipallidum TaxID=3139140 RepID=A0ABU9HM56_9FLAO